MADEVLSCIRLEVVTILLAADDFKNQDTKTVEIGLDRKLSMHCIFWRHVTTASRTISEEILVKW